MNKEIEELLKDIKDISQLNCLNHKMSLNPNDCRELLSYIEQLQEKVELGEHYKHLYSELKKQKDDVVKHIKMLGKFDGEKCTRNFTMWCADFNYLLRMLGEIE